MQIQCRSTTYDAGRDVHPTPVQCWTSAADGGPAPQQHRVNDSSFVSTEDCNQVRISVGSDICHPGCAYTLLYSSPNCSKAWSVQCCLWYTVHYKKKIEVIRNKNMTYKKSPTPGFLLSRYLRAHVHTKQAQVIITLTSRFNVRYFF